MIRHFVAAVIGILSLNAFASEGALIRGVHVHVVTHIKAAASSGYTAIRLWDTGTSWADIEPARGVWRFDRIMATLDESEQEHLKILWTIGNTPRWASSRPGEKCAYGYGCAAEPEQMEDWREYVAVIAGKFKGRVECYEPWNEVSFPTDALFVPLGSGGDPSQFFTGNVDSLVKIAKIAYEEIKRADPNACVTTPSLHSSGDMAKKLDSYLTAGGGRYADVASLHFYFANSPEDVVPAIHALRAVLAKHGLGAIPVWNTEVGVNFRAKSKAFPEITTEEWVYAWILRSYLINVSEGVRRVYWYAWDNGNMGFSEPHSRTDFGSAAAAAAVHLLDGVERVDCSQNHGIWQCRMTAGRRVLMAVWRGKEGGPGMQFTVPKEAKRWGPVTKIFRSGEKIMLDGRPVVYELAI